MKQEFEEYKPTVDAIKTDLEATKGDLAAAKESLDQAISDIKYLWKIVPPPGTILGWVSKLNPADQPNLELPEGAMLVFLLFCMYLSKCGYF